MSKNNEKIVIIGNGVAGVTCARFIRKNSDKEILIISSESEYFFSRTALMYVFMGHMKFEHTQPFEPYFWKKNRIDLKMAHIDEISPTDKTIYTSNGEEIKYDKLVLATGSKPNKFGWKGQDLKGVQGLYSKQDLELLEENTKHNVKHAVIIGGGLIGIEMAEMLLTRGIEITFLVRESRFWGNVLDDVESALIMDHMKKHHVNLKLNTELDEIISDDNGRATGVITKSGERIDCQLVGLTAGVSPNIKLIEGSGVASNRGILINEVFETNIPDIYAIGDCAEFHQNPDSNRRNIEQVWYTGKMMGKSLALTLCGTPTPYNPGNWFNSAKFFDIEYQTYGWINSREIEGVQKFNWRHPDKELAITISFDQSSKTFIGINTFGIRLRHEAFDKWLNESRSVNYVLQNLKTANFDPEFFKSYEQDIINAFNQEFGEKLTPKRKNWKLLFRA